MAEDVTHTPANGVSENGPDTGVGGDPEGGEQEHQGLGPRQQRIAALLTKLASTARSFLLYDPRNETIHRFLTAVLDSFVSTLENEGRIVLSVQPFEVRFEGYTVYLNRDRERSLAFRLYRDGVRTLTFERGFHWEELAQLLEILSIRYTGIHQREDDLVTLLWKADFTHLEVGAVEGIVPDEREETLPADEVPNPFVALPDDLDLPRPKLPPPQGPTWIDVSEERMNALRAEASAPALPEDCVALIDHLRRQLADPSEPMAFAEAGHIFREVRDFLLTEHHLPHLKRFLASLWELAAAAPPAWDPGRHAAVYDLLDACGDRRAVRRLLRSVPPDQRKLKPELLEVLDRACPDPLAAVADALVEEQSTAARAVARQILEHYGSRRPDDLHRRFLEAQGQSASDLLRVIAGLGSDAGVAFIAQQAAHPEPTVQDEALWHLARMPYSGSVGRALLDVFRNADVQRRARVLELIGRTRDRRFVDHLADYVEERAGELGIEEAAQIGRVLGTLGGEPSIPSWQAWLQPAASRRRGLQGPLPRIVAAALALSEIPGEPAAEALGAAFDHCDEESQPWILGALAQRQRLSSRRSV